MKTFLLILLASIVSFKATCQEDMENKIKDLSDKILVSIIKTGNKKIGVSDFANNDGKVCPLGKLIAEELSVEMSVSNSDGKYEVIDRSHLKIILKEHDLNTEGYIDIKTAKALGKIKAVDIIITGNITEYGDYFKLTVKAIDTETASIIAAHKINLAKTESAIQLFKECMSKKSFPSTGPEIAPNECESKRTGDFCFKNSRRHSVAISIRPFNTNNWQYLTLESREEQCFYTLAEGKYDYNVTAHNYNVQEAQSWEGKQGQFYLIKCKSNFIDIR